MPKNAYFGRYQSPNNIILVPTVSFYPPPPHTETEQIVDNTSSPTSPRLNCEQLIPANDNIGEPSASPCLSNCDQQNLKVMSSITSTSTEFSDNFRNSLRVIQDTTSTKTPAFNRSQSIKDLSTTIYKSRNNLVDLTGFNLLKRERGSTSSLPKRKDLRQIDFTKIEQDKMQTNYDENQHRDYSDSDASYKTDKISKESSTSEKPMNTHSEGNTKNLANAEHNENKTDMEDKMKKYFRQLWKSNFDKLKDKVAKEKGAAKEKDGRSIKSSSKTRQEYKDSKQESSRSKANLLKAPKTNSTKDLRNKIKDSSKDYHDLKRRFIDKYPTRSKSETSSRHSPYSKVSIRDRQIDLGPDSIKICKDFQRFIRYNDDHEIKYKSGNQIKTENLPRKKIRMKSCETTTNKPVIKKKLGDKQSIQTEKRSKVNTNQTNLERVITYTDMERAIDQSDTVIKSVELEDKNVHNNLSQCTPSGVQDLRSKLSRKRAKSEYFINYCEPMEKRLDQESLMITVKQDVKPDSKNSPILATTVNKPKRKKSKKIKLIINIECPNSDSDNSVQDFNECCSSPEDFSFLDDFNIDEIVHSLNNSQGELNKTIITDNGYKNNEQIIPKEALINNTSMKAINIITKKEETSPHKGQVIEIYSDTEDVNINIEIGSVANTKKCKDEQNMENSKVDRNTKQEANNITDLTGKGYEENAPKEIKDICKDEQKIKTNSKFDRNTKQDANNETDINSKNCDKNAPKETNYLSDDSNDSVVEVIDITNENKHYMTSKHLQLKKPIQTSTLAKKVNLAKSKIQSLNKSSKPSVNRRIDNTNKKSHNTPHETLRITIEKKSDPTNITNKKQSQLQKSEDPIEASLQAMFNIGQNKSSQLQKSEDPIEASLQAMFNIGQNKSVNSIGVKSDETKELNTLDKHVKEKNDNSHNYKDTVEASLETMFNNYKHKHIEQNKINGCDKKSKENSIQKSVVEKSLESILNGTKHQDSGINMNIEQPSSLGQHIRKEIDVLETAQVIIKVPLEPMNNILDQKKILNDVKIESESQDPVNQILPETTKKGIDQNAEIKINSKPLNVSDIKAKNRSHKFGSISKMSLETEENILEKAREETFEDTGKKPKEKPINNIEKKTNKVISSQLSKNELLFSGNSTKGTLETTKSFAEICLNSPQIDIRPQNGLDRNNKPKGAPLQKSVETLSTTSNVTIDSGKQNSNIRSESNKSTKNTEEKTLLPLENSEVKSQKSPERSNIQLKTNVTTSVELTIPDKNIEVTSRKTSISKDEKSLTSYNKESAVTSKKLNGENQTKSQTVKNNTQKLETIVDALSDLNKITIKDSELGKCSEIATNTKTKQDVVSNKSLVPDGSKNNKKISFLPKLESWLSEYLQKNYFYSSVIHNGRFSTIYKCTTKGETYAVKVVKQRQTGMLLEGMLFLLQQYRSREDSSILYLIYGSQVQDQWCLLTEYYPKNLQQALHEHPHGFHINRVQILSRQLVDAVNMLTNAGITHSDIKPTHILLNNAHDRLKLCGFDRSNYSSCLNILPSSGTSSYRAPEVILGFQEDHRIDVWSTALVMFEMVTNKTLFMASSNNEILYQQLCTFGSLDWSMVEQSRFGALHFSGTNFIRKYNIKKFILIDSLERNENLRKILFQSYEQQWARGRTIWQITKDMDKLESLHKLLEQMLVLDPRYRLRIQFVEASEFMNPDQFGFA